MNIMGYVKSCTKKGIQKVVLSGKEQSGLFKEGFNVSRFKVQVFCHAVKLLEIFVICCVFYAAFICISSQPVLSSV